MHAAGDCLRLLSGASLVGPNLSFVCVGSGKQNHRPGITVGAAMFPLAPPPALTVLVRRVLRGGSRGARSLFASPISPEAPTLLYLLLFRLPAHPPPPSPSTRSRPLTCPSPLPALHWHLFSSPLVFEPQRSPPSPASVGFKIPLDGGSSNFGGCQPAGFEPPWRADPFAGWQIWGMPGMAEGLWPLRFPKGLPEGLCPLEFPRSCTPVKSRGAESL